MALGYLDDSKLYAIASAIRAKTGDSATMTVDDMPDEIGSISAGAQVEPLNVTENGTYSAPTGFAYTPVTVNVSGGGGGDFNALVERTITSAGGNATKIGDNAFQACYSLTTVDFPYVDSVGRNAFYSCSNLTTISFPNCTLVSDYAFEHCRNLQSASFSKCTSINQYAFYGCSKLTSASFPVASIIGPSAFYGCSSLADIYFPQATSIGNCAFSGCTKLTSASFPNVSRLGNSAFQSCAYISTANFRTVASIGNTAFRYCSRLVEIRLDEVSSVPTLGTSAFHSTPIGGAITWAGKLGSVYVPASLYNAFLTATNWSSIASRIVSV